MDTKYASKNSLKRLPFYLDYLKKRQNAGDKYISSTLIARGLGLNDVQVRKDLAMVSQTGGKPKVGYEIEDLISDIKLFLGMKNNNQSILVGVGSLGSALLGYHGFDEYGLSIVGAFDTDAKKIGREVNGFCVCAIEKLEQFCRENEIHIGIIAVPREGAQDACDLLIRAGVKAIWNFAPTKLSVPDDILVQNENMASSLAILSRHLNLKMSER